MQVFIVFSLIIGVSMARPSGVVVAPLAIGVPVSSQYHAQDALGQYSYRYSTGTSAKIEQKTLDGLTTGGFSYLDPNGLVQSVQYTSDPANGFRVAATNLPIGPKPVEDTPEVAAAKTKHLEAVSSRQAVATVVPLGAPKPVEDTPEVAAAKVKHFAAVEEAKARVAVAVPLPELSVVSINPAAVNSLVALPAAVATVTAVPSLSAATVTTAVSRLAPVPAAIAPAVATPLAATPADVSRLAPVPAAASPLAAVPEAVARMAPAPVSPKTSAAATVPTSPLTPISAAVAPVAYSFEAPVPYFYSVSSPSYSFSVGAPILGYSALAPLQLAAPVATAPFVTAPGPAPSAPEVVLAKDATPTDSANSTTTKQ